MNQVNEASDVVACPVCKEDIPPNDRLVMDGGVIHCPDCWLEKDKFQKEVPLQLEELLSINEG